MGTGFFLLIPLLSACISELVNLRCGAPRGMEERPLVNASISTAPGFSGVSVMFPTRDGEGQREAHEEEGTVERRKRDNERKINKVTKKVGQKGGTEGKTTFESSIMIIFCPGVGEY